MLMFDEPLPLPRQHSSRWCFIDHAPMLVDDPRELPISRAFQSSPA